MVKVSVVHYSVKNTGVTADEVREFIKDKYGIDAYVSLHPLRLIVRFTSPVPEDSLKILDKFVYEKLDGHQIQKY